ncbi:MAG: hypothetical protein J6W09_07060 [Bacteroidales bacterium]|nr:hypothetical protein [Bacteroidales bacterium]
MNKLAQTIRFNKELPFSFDGADLVDKIIAVRVREIDEFVLRWLYETYKNEKISKAYVLSEEEFRKFLNKYLPLYEEEDKQ